MAYIPEFKGVIEGYVTNYVAKNLWKIRNTHTHEEAMQEAYIVFLRCSAKYHAVEEPSHFMALFKTAWHNEFIDLSHKATEARNEVSDRVLVGEDDDEQSLHDYMIGELDNQGALGVMVRQAPHEVLLVMNLFLNAPVELIELATEAWRKQGRYKADGDKAVSRMLGLPPNATPMTSTQKYFGGTD